MWESGEGAAARLFPPVPLRRETPHLGDPCQAKQISEESGRWAIKGRGADAEAQSSGQTRKEASPQKGRIAFFRSQCSGGFTTPDPAQKGNPTAFPGVEKTVNSFRPALDLCVCVSLFLSLPSLSFLNYYSSPATSSPTPFLLCTSCRVAANISSRILPAHSSRNYWDVLTEDAARVGRSARGPFQKPDPRNSESARPAPGSRVPRLPLQSARHPAALS